MTKSMFWCQTHACKRHQLSSYIVIQSYGIFKVKPFSFSYLCCIQLFLTNSAAALKATSFLLYCGPVEMKMRVRWQFTAQEITNHELTGERAECRKAEKPVCFNYVFVKANIDIHLHSGCCNRTTFVPVVSQIWPLKESLYDLSYESRYSWHNLATLTKSLISDAAGLFLQKLSLA